MNRTDLTGNASKGGYSGWQTVDATPQEVSAESGLYQLGYFSCVRLHLKLSSSHTPFSPASVPGIKARQDQNFDTLFVIRYDGFSLIELPYCVFTIAAVYSEVDAGLYKWIRKNTGKQPSPKYKGGTSKSLLVYSFVFLLSQDYFSIGFYLLEVDDEAIGLKMSTKHRGTMKREDVTAQYKVMDPTLLEHERGMNRIATLHHDEVLNSKPECFSRLSLLLW